ncbi:MAG: MMPL family transporter [Lachnospiraceae bacterium]|nr:MMPL family transporter [Lachnospiraceae bacterium]
MEKFYGGVIKIRKHLMLLFILAAVVCGYFQQFISVNYDMNDYLPKDAPSTVAIDLMGEEFDGAIPNVRVMIKGVTEDEALAYKKRLEALDGVISVMWLDDKKIMDMPTEMYDQEMVETYYKDQIAIFTIAVDELEVNTVIPAIREVIGDENAMTGSAVSNAVATESTVSEIRLIAVFAVLFLALVLIITTKSWIEPLVVLCGLGVAVMINAGSNLIFGEISFVTNAAGNILQLAVSLDYSIFLIHRFDECRQELEPKAAMKKALCMSTSSILSSGLTTVIGFLALTLMRFRIGPDLGLALAKGVGISLITVFLFMPGVILATYKWMDKTAHPSFLPSFRKLGKLVHKIMIPLVLVFVTIIVPSYITSTKNAYYYGASQIFGPGTQLGDDTEEIQNIFGKSDTYVLMIPKGNIVIEKKMSEELQEIEEITSITSLVDTIGTSIPAEMLPEKILKQLRSEHYDRMVLSVSVDFEGKETEELIDKIQKIAEKYYPGEYHLAGTGISTNDLMKTVTADMVKVNLLAIVAVFIVLLLTMKSLILPIILVLIIETAIWVNLSIPYLMEQPLFYIAYLIISSIQLGATVDYAILFTERYKENRMTLNRKESIEETISNTAASILTSGIVLTVVGFLLGKISTHGLLSQLGYLLGRGTVCSLFSVVFVLPGFLYILDGTFIKKKGRIENEQKKSNRIRGNSFNKRIIAGFWKYAGVGKRG